MFCEKCGAQMDNDSKFCLNCGAPATPQAAPAAAPVAAPAAPAGPSFFSNKKNVLILAIVAAVIVVGIIVGIVIANLPTTIYIDDYITIEYDGLSTRGEADLRFNSEAFEAALLEEMTQQEMYTMMARMQNSNSVLELDKTSELTNGDEIHISFYMDNEIAKDYGVQIKLKNDTITVDSLQEPVFLDLFKDLELTFTGCSPYSRVTFTNNSTNEYIKNNVSYYIDNSYDLEEGETFTVNANFYEYDAEEAGYIILESSKEYTATNLPQPTELNPFDYVEVTFTGLEGEGRAAYKKTGDIDFMSYVSFEFNKSSSLTTGETITLSYTIRYSADPLEYGYKLTEGTTKQYTVPKLGSYVTDFTQLSADEQAKVINKVTELAKYYLTKESDPNGTSEMNLTGTSYWSGNQLSHAAGLGNVKLHSVVAGQSGYWYTNNYLIFVFTVDITGHPNITENSGNTTGAMYIYLSNPIVKGDGTLEIDYDSKYTFNVGKNVYLSYDALKTSYLDGYSNQVVYTPSN